MEGVEASYKFEGYETPRSSRSRSSPYHLSSRTGLRHHLTFVSPKLWRSTGETLPTATGTPVPVASELKIETLVQMWKSEIQVQMAIMKEELKEEINVSTSIKKN